MRESACARASRDPEKETKEVREKKKARRLVQERGEKAKGTRSAHDHQGANPAGEHTQTKARQVEPEGDQPEEKKGSHRAPA